MTHDRNNIIKKVKGWLTSIFIDYEFIKGLYIIGSLLNPVSNFQDIDIVQYTSFKTSNEMVEFSKMLSNIRKTFFTTFNVPLHITTFTQNEEPEFRTFMSKNIFIKII
jgi:hypothetical protein